MNFDYVMFSLFTNTFIYLQSNKIRMKEKQKTYFLKYIESIISD